MTDDIKTERITVQPVFDLLNEVDDVLGRLVDIDVVISHPSVGGRREASAQRAQVKTDLSYASHLLEKARILVDGEHQKVTRAAKEASGAYA